MKKTAIILFCALLSAFIAPAQQEGIKVDFYGTLISLPQPAPAAPLTGFTPQSIQQYIAGMAPQTMEPYLKALLQYKQENDLDDWLYYQLVRKMAQQLSPKETDYYRYTLYKWWLLAHSGYDTRLMHSGAYLLFYIQSNELIYNIPFRMQQGLQYVCLNYHDYGNINFDQFKFAEIELPLLPQAKPFSYRVKQLPKFNPADYTEQQLSFENRQNQYRFQIKVNPQIKSLFTNYPVVDYSLQFNMPLSTTTYQSLIPALKKELQGMKPKEGVDFLMRFTRYAFLFQPDAAVFGSEKRLSAEQTLLSASSDCEDRSALFFFLVKEIYNLPMLVLAYPKHVTVAVQFDKAYGASIDHEGTRYTVCEPSPQRYDLNIGQLPPELRHQPYEIAYAYRPQ